MNYHRKYVRVPGPYDMNLHTGVLSTAASRAQETESHRPVAIAYYTNELARLIAMNAYASRIEHARKMLAQYEAGPRKKGN